MQLRPTLVIPNNLLAIETSGAACSLALATQDRLYTFFQLTERQHAAILLPAIHDLLEEAHLSIADLDAIAFSAGPGSFTGIRLAASVAQGLAFSANLPIFPVSTLQALAQGAFVETGSERVCVLLNAYGGEVYWGVYHAVGGFMEPCEPEQRSKPSEVIALSSEWVGVGDDSWRKYAAELPVVPTQLDLQRNPHAKEVAQLARREGVVAVYGGDAVPHYLHPDTCWRKHG